MKENILLSSNLYRRMFSVLFIVIAGQNLSFAQCASGTTVFSENFNIAGNTNSKATFKNSLSTTNGSQSQGDYAGSGCDDWNKITNYAQGSGGGANKWKSNTVEDPTWPTTGHDGGGITDFAYLLDGCDAIGDGTVWCDTLTVSNGQIYNFSAFFTSPWLNDKTANDPAIYLTINGVRISSLGIVDQSNSTTTTTSGYTPWYQQQCTYTISGVGTNVKVPFCIGLTQSTDGGVTFGNYGWEGNNVILDDIVIQSCPSGTTNACVYTGTIVTPMILTFFSGKKEGNRALLQWITASEQNSSYFSVEKSADAVNYNEIGTVNARGNSSNPISYEFEDNQFNEASYYRLKMIDKDDSFKYSSLTFLKNDISARIISSMDNKGELQIKAIVNEDSQWNLAIYSLMGQEYLNEKIGLVKGENTILKGISGGEQSAKIIRITGEDGMVILSEMVIW
jgi:hypothetical protein